MQEVPLYPEPKSGRMQPLKCQRHRWQGYGSAPGAGIDAPCVCEPWLENIGGAEPGSERCREGARQWTIGDGWGGSGWMVVGRVAQATCRARR